MNIGVEHSISKKHLAASLLLALVLVCGLLAAIVGRTSAADSCAPTGTTYGTDTLTVNIPSATTYTIWTRLQIPNSSDNSVLLSIDASSCYNVGGNSSLPTGSWQWVNYYDGSTANVVSLPLTAGSHTFKFTGTSPNVQIDQVLALSDSSCTPTGTGTNCEQTTTAPPTVSLGSGPSSGAQLKGSVSLTANATAAAGDSIVRAQLLVNGAVVQTDTSPPYNFTLNTLNYKDGAYTLTVNATDNQSLVGTTTVSIVITNGDVTGDSKVNISDLSVLAAHWGAQSATSAQGDINGDGKVGVADLSVLANNWQQSW